METKNNNNNDRIELRSEKVRSIIGTIPPALVHWGIAVITIIFVILMLVIFLVHYPYAEGESIYFFFFN